MDQKHPLPVRIAHADPIIAAGIHALLENDGRLHVSRQEPAQGGAGIDVVIADRAFALQFLDDHGRKSGSASSRPRLLIVSQLDREQEIRAAVAAGVEGYVLHGCSADELRVAVATVARGVRYIAAPIVARLAESLTRTPLSAREHDVLELIAAGQCNKGIARDLEISVGTVKSHVRAILSKLSASSRVQAVYHAQTRGILPPTRVTSAVS